MVINFVGNYQNGYVGEISDESHLARELEDLGHTVNKVPRDQWKAFVDGEQPNADWVLPTKADFNVIAKWDRFDSADYIKTLRAMSEAPVFYWVWDYMLDPIFAEWHIKMAQAADLYLSGEMGLAHEYRAHGVKFYYFQMDVCDGRIPTFGKLDKTYDVIFTGSCIGQGHRKEWLEKINKEIPVTIFSWNPEEWFKMGFKECYPAVYGEQYNKIIAQSKIVLGFSVESNCWGYWSNRVGKVLRAGGFLLQEYAPGMETQISGNIDFFSSPEEAVSKIKEWLNIDNSPISNTDRWTSHWKMSQLIVLMERYLKGDPKQWKLP